MYYIIYNNQQFGPMEKEQLAGYGLTPDSLVWSPGMSGWVAASSVPELEDVLRSVNVQVCPQPMPEQVQSPRRANWLVPAIISAVVAFMFSCIEVVFGIIAVVKASKANSLYQQQMYEEAEAQNSTAKTMTIIAFVFGGIGTLMFNILFGLDLSRIL